MRSAKHFATDFTSVWNELTPTMELFVRAVNAGLAQRRFRPLPHNVAAGRRAFVNEIAFRWFALSWNRLELRSQLFGKAVEQATRTIIALENRSDAGSVGTGLERSEEWDIRHQASRLYIYFSREKVLWGSETGVVVDPFFPGCGFVESARGDVRIGQSLYEVKSGDRHFRSIDFRQLLTYTALFNSGSLGDVQRVTLFNARTGMIFQCRLSALSQEVAGCTAEELTHNIRERMSNGDLSS